MADPNQSPEKRPRDTSCGRTRREFLWQTGGGFTGLALGSMLAQDGFLANQAVAAAVNARAGQPDRLQARMIGLDTGHWHSAKRGP